jgi:uncharacterized protein YbjT (DUF2867 family)
MGNIARVVVLGGSGLIGGRTVNRLREFGLDVVSASRRNGVNTLTGEGLEPAFAGADVVLDTSDVHSFDEETLQHFFATSGENVARAERAAGVKHHVTLSIVGVDRIDGNPYYAAKRLQEAAARHSGVPYTIARSTQFYEFFPTIAGGFSKGSVVSLPAALLQPVAADDVAAALTQVVLGAPKSGPWFIGGPERATLATWIGRVFEVTSDRRTVEVDPKATWFGAPLDEDSIVPQAADYVGTTSFAEWATTLQAKQSLLGDRYAEAVSMMDRQAAV